MSSLAPALWCQQPSGFVPVTDAILENPSPGDWLMWRRTLNSWGYSPLTEINRSNVRKLKMIWTRGMSPGIQEGTPLVYNGILYMPNPFDVMEALNAATGAPRWTYRRQLAEDVRKIFPVPEINRNIAIYGTNLIDTSADDFVYAIDARTGKLAWEQRILDYRELPAQHTSGPITVRGKIISGRGCEPRSGPEACVMTAHDARTGKELWRTRTIPKPGEPGDESWGDVPYEQRKHVGTWMVPSYDPELNLVYFGTSVTSPAPKFILGGNDKKHLFHNCTLALNADTGKIVWYYQHLVDHWDIDHPFERLIIDSAVRPDPSQVTWINPKLVPGERRKIITGIPGKTGIIYTLDRQTGEFLWAKPTVRQNLVAKIDGRTGEVIVNPETVFTARGQQRFVCPAQSGGKNWTAGAYNPVSNTMFFPLENTCETVTATTDQRNSPSFYGISYVLQLAPDTTNLGAVHAVDVATGRTTWKYEQRASVTSLLATGGDLLFGGDDNGYFRAFDQSTGKVLWEVNLGSSVTGFPITYAVGGRQYVAVSTGRSLISGRLIRQTPELNPTTANNLFVFSLPTTE